MEGWQAALTILGSLLGSGAAFGFAQFWITRKDEKEKEAKRNREEEIKQEMRDHLTEVNAQWKEDYCDKNRESIAALHDAVVKGLQDREDVGRQRYEEHHLAIEKMTVEHQKEFLELKKAIDKLTSNESAITESIAALTETQTAIGASLVGQAHDRIMFLSDRIAERGGITNREKATIKSMYVPYRKLGGNGEVQEAVEYILTLETVSEDEARSRDREIKSKEFAEIQKLTQPK